MSTGESETMPTRQAAAAGRHEELAAFLTTDYAGITRGRSVPLSDLDRWLPRGCGWVPANSALTPFDVFADDNPWGSHGDLRLLPDPASRFSVANLPGATGLHGFMADIVETDGSPWHCCPRVLLKRAIAELEAAGLRALVAFEHEFQLDGDGPAAPAFSLRAQRLADPVGPLLMRSLEDAGAEPEMFLPEYGRRQFEVTVRPASALVAADRAVMVREITREVTRLLGWRASFSPKVVPDGVGNGVHVHLSLTDPAGRPVGFDPSRAGAISEVAGSFAAGILRHLPALTAFTAPSVVSYLRLVPGHLSAAWTCFGDRNREASLRICPISPLVGSDPARQLNLEYRALDATAGPHLALAVILLAGLEGVRGRLAAPPLIDVDPGSIPESERRRLGVERLPASQVEAIAALERDPVVLGWFSAGMLSCYRAMRAKERELVAGLDPAGLCERYGQVY